MSRTVSVEDVFRVFDGAPRHGVDPTYDQARADVRAHLESLFTGMGVAVVTVLPEPPNAHAFPYDAGKWLAGRHRTIGHLIDRLDSWLEEEDAEMPDLEKLAEGINAADELGAAWKAYQYRNPEPRGIAKTAAEELRYEGLYDQWQEAGPKTDNAVAVAYGPMSGGEKRMLRMLAMLAPTTRIRFNLSDSEGVDQGYRDDWLRLVSSP